MTDIVDPEIAATIVGADRHATDHIGRAVSAEQKVYILHSQECLDTQIDLRWCEFSKALDRGIILNRWIEDMPVRLAIVDGRLEPDRIPEPGRD